MTNHLVSFPLKKKKKKEEKKLHRGHKDEDSFPVSKAFHASTPSAKRHKSPKEEEETSCLPSIRKIWNPKVERSSSSSSSSTFRGKSCHGGGGGGGGGHTRMSNVRCADVTRVWMRCGARRSTVSVPVISPRCTGRGSRAEDRWHCFLCPSRGWDEDEQKLVGEEREGRDRQRPVGNGASRWYLRGRGSNLYNESF